jgi:hypothetical protein
MERLFAAKYFKFALSLASSLLLISFAASALSHCRVDGLDFSNEFRKHFIGYFPQAWIVGRDFVRQQSNYDLEIIERALLADGLNHAGAMFLEIRFERGQEFLSQRLPDAEPAPPLRRLPLPPRAR